jgi:carotenoid cleavage dioxygenase-like enzyme
VFPLCIPAGHDFLLTENYYIFHQTPFYKLSPANVAKIISGAYAPGQLMRYYPGTPLRSLFRPSRCPPPRVFLAILESSLMHDTRYHQRCPPA